MTGKKPFFLNLCHYAVHEPIQVKPEDRERFVRKARELGLDQETALVEGELMHTEDKAGKRVMRRVLQSDPDYAAMIWNLDWNIGRLLHALEESGQAENTVVIFTSDNGGLSIQRGLAYLQSSGKGRKGLDGEEYIPIGIQTEKDNPRKLTALEVTQGEVSVEITPQNFVQLREILAAQNEVELPDETLNAELVQAERDLATKSSLNLVPDSEALIYSVSVKTQIPVEDIFQWTVRRFVLTERAIDRITGHLVAALSEAAGAKYKNGNPWPSWKYDRDKHSSALVSLAELTQRLSGSVEAR